MVTGLTASGVFGITTAIAAANQPTYTAAPASVPTATTGLAVVDPNSVPTSAVPPPAAPGAVENVVLTIPPLGGAVVPAGATPAAAAAPAATAARPPASRQLRSYPYHAGTRTGPGPDAHHRRPGPHRTPTTPCTTNASGKCK